MPKVKTETTKQLAVVKDEPHISESPMQMLQAALASNMAPETIKSLLDLRDRWEATEAKKAFVIAMGAFKAEPIEIFKTKKVSFATQTGTTSYKHAELSDITAAIAEPLAKHGLSYRWDVSQADNITVSCIMTHESGHSEKVTMTAPPDDSGKKNRIQQIASTVTYLERYTLLAVTGLSTTGQDDDGQAAGSLARISEDQAANLQALIDEIGKDAGERASIRSAFLKYRQVDSLEDIAAQADRKS